MELRGLSAIMDRYSQLENSVTTLMDGTQSAEEQVLARMIQFSLQTDLNKFDQFILALESPPERSLLMQRLAPFYLAGVWLEPNGLGWQVLNFFVRGEAFSIEENPPQSFNLPVPEMSPLDVKTSIASPVLKRLELEFLRLPKDCRSFLFRPTPHVALILFSDTPPLWQEDLIRKTLTLINKAFTP